MPRKIPMPKKKYKRVVADNYTLKEILYILENTIEDYMEDDAPMSFQKMMMQEHGIMPNKMDHWRATYPEVEALWNTLKSIRLVRYNDRLLDGEGVNTGAMIWYGKVNLKQVPEEIKYKTESDKENLGVDKDTVINIGFATPEVEELEDGDE